MDSTSSPGSIDSTSTAPTPASKVTYTTAGTPYNPNTLPLQPPVRRCRMLKWTAGLHTSGLSLFPKSALASLPVKFVNHSSSSQEYSPLQTSFDQVISPIHDIEHTCVNMSAEVPRLVASATPSPLPSLFSDAARAGLSDGEASDDGENEYELGMDPLLNMTVKSLQNLASYPNPNQKRAQKALFRGTKAAREAYKMYTRSEEPSTPLNRRTGHQEPPQIHVDSPSMLRYSQTETIGYARPQDDGFWNPPGKSYAIQPDTAKPFDAAVGGRTSDKFSSATLASGPGAPRPLSAGPPGHRQYRPSTFKSTFKALQPQASVQDMDEDEDEDVLMITRQILRQAGIDENIHEPKSPLYEQSASLNTAPISVTPQKTMSSTKTFFENLNEERGANQGGLANNNSRTPFERLCSQQLPISTSWNPTPVASTGRYAHNEERDANQGGLANDNSRTPFENPFIQQPLFSGNWNPAPIASTGRYEDISRANKLQKRREMVERAWYAGTHFMKATTEELERDTQFPRPKCKFGAVGDGRPIKKGGEQRSTEPEKIEHLSVAELAGPLLDMAYVKVKQFKEDEVQKKNAREASVV
ncbi:hypothetical protein N0V84_007721 [Fusarium piperis]|uniref:Uncharacterized protein n=1 Tax=Fusarium piperis TaxID=1435070 RepID=A0A9W9BN33_9HYPO|nr:hypothetical protein N0V84_007721 [Fusarium piperis]